MHTHKGENTRHDKGCIASFYSPIVKMYMHVCVLELSATLVLLLSKIIRSLVSTSYVICSPVVKEYIHTH